MERRLGGGRRDKGQAMESLGTEARGGGVKFESLKIVLKHAHTDAVTGKVTEAVSINYGNFINTALDFLIIAFSIFLFVKLINSMKRKEETKPTPPPAPSKEEQLLTEIRDLLKGKNS